MYICCNNYLYVHRGNDVLKHRGNDILKHRGNDVLKHRGNDVLKHRSNDVLKHRGNDVLKHRGNDVFAIWERNFLFYISIIIAHTHSCDNYLNSKCQEVINKLLPVTICYSTTSLYYC